MDDDVLVGLELEVRDVERADGVHRGDDGPVALLAAPRRPQLLANLAQGPQDTGAIEALPLTVFTKAHDVSVLPGVAGRPANPV
jgi:hypothetical protein